MQTIKNSYGFEPSQVFSSPLSFIKMEISLQSSLGKKCPPSIVIAGHQSYPIKNQRDLNGQGIIRTFENDWIGQLKWSAKKCWWKLGIYMNHIGGRVSTTQSGCQSTSIATAESTTPQLLDPISSKIGTTMFLTIPNVYLEDAMKTDILLKCREKVQKSRLQSTSVLWDVRCNIANFCTGRFQARLDLWIRETIQFVDLC